jgi:crotonobetainyl-CoA:carnitine CoA-transferase CaiB-like acyl-CoA transferase
MMLGDLGAEVIKIEEPGRGDYMRDFPPKFKKEGVFFLAVNRNKKSMTLNLRSERGKEVFFDLVKKADVVLEGFRPGVMDKLGIGYKDLEKINPRIIVCSISGYGQDGPYVNKAGHDVNSDFLISTEIAEALFSRPGRITPGQKSF